MMLLGGLCSDNMCLVYIDVWEMEAKFRSYDLNFDNILEFMAADDKAMDRYFKYREAVITRIFK